MTAIQAIHFGTDGWRGQIADDYTFENVRAVAQATAEQMHRELTERGLAGSTLTILPPPAEDGSLSFTPSMTTTVWSDSAPRSRTPPWRAKCNWSAPRTAPSQSPAQ